MNGNPQEKISDNKEKVSKASKEEVHLDSEIDVHLRGTLEENSTQDEGDHKEEDQLFYKNDTGN